MTLRCDPALSPEEVAGARILLREYEASLGIDLCFQGFGAEPLFLEKEL